MVKTTSKPTRPSTYAAQDLAALVAFAATQGAVESHVTQSHIDSTDSTTTCVHFKFITGVGTPHTSLAAPDTPQSFADVRATTCELFPGAFGEERPQAPNHLMSVASSAPSSSLPPINDEDMPMTPISSLSPTSTNNQQVRTINRSSDIISISSDEEFTDDDDATEPEIPFELYTQGNGVLFVNDMTTGWPTNRIVADSHFECITKARSSTRFYVVTVGSDIGIFDDVDTCNRLTLGVAGQTRCKKATYAQAVAEFNKQLHADLVHRV